MSGAPAGGKERLCTACANGWGLPHQEPCYFVVWAWQSETKDPAVIAVPFVLNWELQAFAERQDE